jgi:hypothetical protein
LMASARVERYLNRLLGRVCLHFEQVRVCILCLVLDKKVN